MYWSWPEEPPGKVEPPDDEAVPKSNPNAEVEEARKKVPSAPAVNLERDWLVEEPTNIVPFGTLFCPVPPCCTVNIETA